MNYKQKKLLDRIQKGPVYHHDLTADEQKSVKALIGLGKVIMSTGHWTGDSKGDKYSIHPRLS